MLNFALVESVISIRKTFHKAYNKSKKRNCHASEFLLRLFNYPPQNLEELSYFKFESRETKSPRGRSNSTWRTLSNLPNAASIIFDRSPRSSNYRAQ